VDERGKRSERSRGSVVIAAVSLCTPDGGQFLGIACRPYAGPASGSGVQVGTQDAVRRSYRRHRARGHARRAHQHVFVIVLFTTLPACSRHEPVGAATSNNAASVPASPMFKGEVVAELDKHILHIFQAEDSVYWFGSDGQGVYRDDGKELVRFTTEQGLSSDRVRGIQEDRLSVATSQLVDFAPTWPSPRAIRVCTVASTVRCDHARRVGSAWIRFRLLSHSRRLARLRRPSVPHGESRRAGRGG
jgi:hypothetical protein